MMRVWAVPSVRERLWYGGGDGSAQNDAIVECTQAKIYMNSTQVQPDRTTTIIYVWAP